MNKFAPIILALLVVVAVVQVLSSRGGDRVEADNGIVSEADLRQETTTTIGQRTFVTLDPLPDTSLTVASRRPTVGGPTISRPEPSGSTPSSGSTPTTGSTTEETRPSTTGGGTGSTTEPPPTGSTAPTTVSTAPTTGSTPTTGEPTTTRKPTTTGRPTTTEPPPTNTTPDVSPGPAA